VGKCGELWERGNCGIRLNIDNLHYLLRNFLAHEAETRWYNVEKCVGCEKM
jgi:hypothetical protein